MDSALFTFGKEVCPHGVKEAKKKKKVELHANGLWQKLPSVPSVNIS